MISYFIICFSFAIITAYFATKINKNPYLWFLIGLAFGVTGLIIIFFMSLTKIKNKKSKKNFNYIKDTKLWYYLYNDQSIGPYSLNKLIDLFNEKKISLNTYVWNEELSDWKYLKDTKEYLKIKEITS